MSYFRNTANQVHRDASRRFTEFDWMAFAVANRFKDLDDKIDRVNEKFTYVTRAGDDELSDDEL